MYEEYKQKIVSFYRSKRRMPSYREIMNIVGFQSKNAVYKLVEKLVNEGVVSKDKEGKLIPSFHFDETPFLGVVEAGIPSVVDAEILETMSIDNYLVKNKEKTFILEVKGDSMIEAHIEEGDYVIVERTNSPKVGDIVIAEVDGEWTMKFLREKGGKKWLEPANKDYKAIYPSQSLRIAAVVKGVIRKYS